MLTGKKTHRFDRPHTGKVETPASNERWCSDCFDIPCRNGDVVRVAFALNCRDREALGPPVHAPGLPGEGIRLLRDEALWSRFGERNLTAPVEIEWLSKKSGLDASTVTIPYARAFCFRPLPSPGYSPESNGMAEAFVNTIKRDYAQGTVLSHLETVVRPLHAWIDDDAGSPPLLPWHAFAGGVSCSQP